MTNAQLLVPLRVPELGPSLGKLVTGTGREIAGFPLEPHRYRLATRIIEMGGEARRLAANNQRTAALASLGRDAWLAAWEEAVSPVADELVQHLTAHLEAEATAVGMPHRLRRQVGIDDVEGRAIAARLGSAGANLIPQLDDIERHAAPLVAAPSAQRGVLEPWQQALLAAARRLEEAWMALEDAIDQELTTWRAIADGVARWRRSLWPVYLVGGVAVAAATWGGLIWGGVLPIAPWMRDLWDAVRSLVS
jgi:hypothetical protein